MCTCPSENLEIPRCAIAHLRAGSNAPSRNDGFESYRALRRSAMRFDLVDLQLFIAVTEARSITAGALRAHLALASASARIKGLELSLGVELLKRGRRGIELTAAGESLLDHARIIMNNVETMRGDLAAYARGLKANIHALGNTSGLSEHLPKALAAFLADNPNISIDVEERESVDRFPFCDDRLVIVTSRRDSMAGRRQIEFQEVIGLDFLGLASNSALQKHIAGHATRLGARLRFRARLRDFDAICQMVAAGVGIAVVSEAAARRCARSMPIAIVKIRDPWANRRLAICARSFKSLPRPAKLLGEHLRKGAG